MIRDDLSNRLIHLTKGAPDQAGEAFLEIIRTKKLIGSNNDIKGGHKVICFSEAPISKLGIILATPNAENMRYRPFGLMFDKKYLFAQGARPVIYQTNDEYKTLPFEIQYRHVRFEPANNIDWTWEREWRICIDEFVVDPDEVTLIIPNRSWEAQLRKAHHDQLEKLASFDGDFGMRTIGDFAWHFIVLEDLGFDMPDDYSNV